MSNSVSLLVGFPKVPNSHKLGALHRKFGVRQEEKLDIVNGFAIDVPSDKVDAYIESLPEEATVMYDQPIFAPRQKRLESEDLADSSPEELDLRRPAGLEKLHLEGLTGENTTIAVIDSGLVPHGDFQDRNTHFQDFVNPQNKTPIDVHGHGTHVAGIAAGDGDLIDGIAPKADLVSLRVFYAREAVRAINWAVDHKDEYGIDILNLSLGVEDKIPHRDDPLRQATQRAIDAGLIAVVAAGNEGDDCGSESGNCPRTISSPGVLPDAITVGAFNDMGTDDPDDDVMWTGSSQGPTAIDGLPKPDLVAQGYKIVAPNAKNSRFSRTRPRWENYHYDTGSSMSTAMVSGAAALMLQIDPDLTQAEIKEALTETADPMLGVSKYDQGAGRLNLAKAIELVKERAS